MWFLSRPGLGTPAKRSLSEPLRTWHVEKQDQLEAPWVAQAGPVPAPCQRRAAGFGRRPSCSNFRLLRSSGVGRPDCFSPSLVATCPYPPLTLPPILPVTITAVALFLTKKTVHIYLSCDKRKE